MGNLYTHESVQQIREREWMDGVNLKRPDISVLESFSFVVGKCNVVS
jgi:hypothetical protein